MNCFSFALSSTLGYKKFHKLAGVMRISFMYSGYAKLYHFVADSNLIFVIYCYVTFRYSLYKMQCILIKKNLLFDFIQGMTLSDFNKLDFDMILMSPPCQPFTR